MFLEPLRFCMSSEKSSLEEKKARLQKFIDRFEKKPESGILKPGVKATLENDIVVLSAGNWTWKEDLPPVLGGTNTEPGPLQHLLGALAGCAAGLIKNTLAPLTGVPVDKVDVNIQCDFDVRACLGIEGATADLSNTVFNVTIYSKADPRDVKDLFEIWKQRAPVLLGLEKPMQIQTNLEIKEE